MVSPPPQSTDVCHRQGNLNIDECVALTGGATMPSESRGLGYRVSGLGFRIQRSGFMIGTLRLSRPPYRGSSDARSESRLKVDAATSKVNSSGAATSKVNFPGAATSKVNSPGTSPRDLPVAGGGPGTSDFERRGSNLNGFRDFRAENGSSQGQSHFETIRKRCLRVGPN